MKHVTLSIDNIFLSLFLIYTDSSTPFLLHMQVVLGTLLAALVPVVGFNAVMTSEHFASFLVSYPTSKGLLVRPVSFLCCAKKA